MTILAWAVAAMLAAFTARRYLFWLGSLLPRRAVAPSRTATITLLIAARDEAAHLPKLFAALDASDYPHELLSFVLVSDGSIDATPQLMIDWATRTPRAEAITLPVSGRKGAALQAALAVAPPSDLVMVIDADTSPAADALAWLAGAFADAAVGACCGYPDPGRHHTSIVARYAALERWVSHLVTWAGQDRLGLRPPDIGAFFAVRRQALVQIGGFVAATAAEDIELTLALTQAGWKTRWMGMAIVREDVPDNFTDFRLQRLRWSLGLLANLRHARSIEDAFALTGYLDRLVFVAGAGFAMFGVLPVWLPLSFAAAPLILMLTALYRARAPHWLRYLWSIIPMMVLDIAVTLESTLAHLRRRPVRWKEG